MQDLSFGHSQKSPPPSKIDPGFKYKSQETSFHQKLPSSLFWHRIDVSTPSKVTVHDIEDSLESPRFLLAAQPRFSPNPTFIFLEL